jgi:hypothetical protein
LIRHFVAGLRLFTLTNVDTWGIEEIIPDTDIANIVPRPAIAVQSARALAIRR